MNSIIIAFVTLHVSSRLIIVVIHLFIFLLSLVLQ